MPMDGPALTTRIPTPPWGEFADRHLVHIDEYVKTGGYKALQQALSMDPKDVIETVKGAELRGRGGAGFPCGLKWGFLPEPDGGRRYLALNCDEAEPGTFKDRLLIDFDPHLVLEGIAIACWACQLDTAYFFIRGEYREQIPVVEQAIREAYDYGIFGKQGLFKGAVPFSVDCYLHKSAGAYICGEETGLIEAIEGKRAWPRVKPPFPAVEGIFRRPTIVNNVETLSAVPGILVKGADWFKSMGSESTIGAAASYGSKLMGVSGHVVRPGVYECDLGISVDSSSSSTAAACGEASGQGLHPRRREHGRPGSRPVRCRTRLRHRPQVRPDGSGHRLSDHLRPGHRHGGRRPEHLAVLPQRILRSAHRRRGSEWLYKLLC